MYTKMQVLTKLKLQTAMASINYAVSAYDQDFKQNFFHRMQLLIYLYLCIP